MRPAHAVRRAFLSQTEGEVPLLTYEDLLEQFGSNTGIAAAAGLTDARSTERKTLMRDLQRYGKGTRAASPDKMAEIAEQVGIEVGAPLGLDDAVEAMRQRGLSFVRLVGVMNVSSEQDRQRDVPSARGGSIHIAPELLTASLAELMGDEDDGGPSLLDLVAARRWSRAVPLFLQAVVVSGYGMPASTSLGELDDLLIDIPQ